MKAQNKIQSRLNKLTLFLINFFIYLIVIGSLIKMSLHAYIDVFSENEFYYINKSNSGFDYIESGRTFPGNLYFRGVRSDTIVDVYYKSDTIYQTSIKHNSIKPYMSPYWVANDSINLPGPDDDTLSYPIVKIDTTYNNWYLNLDEPYLYSDEYIPAKPDHETGLDIYDFEIVKAEFSYRSDDKFLNFIGKLKNYLDPLLYFFIAIQLIKFNNNLGKKFNFNPKLVKRVMWIGLAIMLHQLILWVINSRFTAFFYRAELKHINYESDVSLYMSPDATFNWHIFIIGVFIFLLSFLIKKGVQLKEEVDLTI